MTTHDEHKDAFLAAVKGIPTNFVTRALGQHTLGTVWTGCTKDRMATHYAESKLIKGGYEAKRFAPLQSLDDLRATALQFRKYAADHRKAKEEAAAKKAQRRDALQREQEQREADIATLRAITEEQNNGLGQGGALGYMGDGQWGFVSKAIYFEPHQLNALFRLTGVEPRPVHAKGECRDCANSVNGIWRGFEQPCSSCRQPLMSNFKPKAP